MAEPAPIRIGNVSGFYGDRFAAMREMLAEGRPDVLTGDYLAELTMLILGRDRLRDPELGYARTFLRQLEDCLGLALERGVRIVSNAGGLALTVARLWILLPETAAYPTTRYLLPNLRALNFVVDGLLGEGVAASTRFDPQAKALGEWLRSQYVDIPESLLDS